MILNRYPFQDNVKIKIVKPTGKYAHENWVESKYAIDFLCSIDTPIICVKSGVVAVVKDDSDKYGFDEKFANDANFVCIQHKDGTYAEYVHLGKDKVVVKVGQKFKTGDILGYAGLSGCMSEPHLHLNFFIIEDEKGISIPAEFKIKKK